MSTLRPGSTPKDSSRTSIAPSGEARYTLWHGQGSPAEPRWAKGREGRRPGRMGRAGTVAREPVPPAGLRRAPVELERVSLAPCGFGQRPQRAAAGAGWQQHPRRRHVAQVEPRVHLLALVPGQHPHLPGRAARPSGHLQRSRRHASAAASAWAGQQAAARGLACSTSSDTRAVYPASAVTRLYTSTRSAMPLWKPGGSTWAARRAGRAGQGRRREAAAAPAGRAGPGGHALGCVGEQPHRSDVIGGELAGRLRRLPPALHVERRSVHGQCHDRRAVLQAVWRKVRAGRPGDGVDGGGREASLSEGLRKGLVARQPCAAAVDTASSHRLLGTSPDAP